MLLPPQGSIDCGGATLGVTKEGITQDTDEAAELKASAAAKLFYKTKRPTDEKHKAQFQALISAADEFLDAMISTMTE